MGTVGAFDRLTNRRALAPDQAPRPPQTAVVSRIDATGVYVTPLGSDLTAILIGPVAGGYYRDTSSCSGAAHSHPLVPIPLGTEVLLVRTPDGEDWIAHVDWRP